MANETDNTTPGVKTPQHPFNKPTADLIIRSADLVDFRVHSQILAEASPFFASMLSLPQPAPKACPAENGATAGAEPEDATPIVPVSEDSKALDLLLRLVYPIPKPRAQMEDPHAMVPALLAAAKYEMALPTEVMSEQLIVLITKNPLQVWAAACRAGLEGVARKAAEAFKTSWTRNGENEALACMDVLVDMTGISAGDYYRLKLFLTTTDRLSVKEGAFTLLSPMPRNPLPRRAPAPTARAALFATDLSSTDVICRSSSRGGLETRFAAHQVILSMRSPLLKARLEELRGSQLKPASASATSKETSSPAQIWLDFDEGPEVLSVLLRACYDGVRWSSPQSETDLDVLAGLLVAARKYKMETIAGQARAAWDDAAALRPLEAYFVALGHGLKECAKKAASALSGGQVKDVYVPAMDSAPALAYHRLLQFYDSCCAVAKKRMAQEVGTVPQTVYDGSYGTLNTNAITASWKSTSVPFSRGDGAKVEMRKTLYDSVVRAIAKDRYPSSSVWMLVSSALRCVALAPDNIDEALKEVQINLG